MLYLKNLIYIIPKLPAKFVKYNNFMRLIYYYNIIHYFYDKFIFYITLIRRPRNYFIILLDYLEQPVVNFSLGQFFIYFNWRRRLEMSWTFLLQTFINNILDLKNIKLCCNLGGRRWTLYRWLRRLFLIYIYMGRELIYIKWLTFKLNNRHGFWRLKKIVRRKRRLARSAVGGDIA